MLSPNTILRSRYRIIQLLGHGGMGAVYQAIDENLSRLVAVKEAFGSSGELRRAFRREAELLANLRHRALPKSIEHFSENNSDYFVMEFVPGNDLGELLKLRAIPFAESDVLRWADEVLDVLAYLHRKGLIHRDIKPSNLKLTKEGELFVLDFGLAKGAVGQMGTLVTSQSLRGYTPAYASLEQILGQATDARSDVYSLGATLYHLLTGAEPINASTRFQRIDDDGNDPLPLIQHENPLVSPHVAGIIHSAMAINRKGRAESAEQMREALRSPRADEPPQKIPSAGSVEPGPTQPSPTEPEREDHALHSAESQEKELQANEAEVRSDELARHARTNAQLELAQRRLQIEAEEKALIERNEELQRRRAEIEIARDMAEEEARRLAEIKARIEAGEIARRRAEHERLRLEADVRLRAHAEQERLKETRDRIVDANVEIEELRRREEEAALRAIEAEAKKREYEERLRTQVESQRRAEEGLRLLEEETELRAEQEKQLNLTMSVLREQEKEQTKRLEEIQTRLSAQVQACYVAEAEERELVEREKRLAEDEFPALRPGQR